MAATAAEQLLIELINRARLDPGAEAARMGVDLNQGLDPGTIGTFAMEVLAPDAELDAAARGHAQWMLAQDIFSHDGANGSSAGDRMAAAGYDFTGSWAWGENLSWIGSSGAVDLNQAITRQYANLFESPGHRENTLDPGFREIGVSQLAGPFNGYNSAMLTENFARAGTTVFVTGVAFDDRDGDGFYDIGEGRGGVRFAAQGAQDDSAAAGGYGVAVSAGPVAVTITDGGALVARLLLDLSQGNAKLDLIGQGAGRSVLATSVDTQLLEGLSSARLLGIGDLDLTGLRTANKLWGNAGDNVIGGGGGGDRLWGMAGADTLQGGRGRDRLDGGQGDDTMTGSGGGDQFVFVAGADRISDFTARDRLMLDGDALDGQTLADLMASAQVTEAGLVLTLDSGSLTLEGLTDAGLLAGRVEILG